MVFSAFLAVLRPADIPVVPGADEARRWAQEELAKKVYQDAKPGWAEQLFAMLKKAFAELLGKLGVADANIGLAVVVGLVLLAAIAIVLIIRPRLNRRKAATDAVFDGEKILSSEQHRTMARTAARSGDFHTAVSESFRAMVRAAEERAVSVPALGLTAAEIVGVLERAFPSHREALLHSAELFNAVRYGMVPPTAAMYEELQATERSLAATTPHYADEFPAVHS
ncbi:hypothetical protein ART_1706 [Arthrobacter sp. PAMC 25486]|uniref:DUF4129 domain-containing protein n=1 Tax=Arthrobacter sp. PAMC 25486 TaxID=1494608 RepID=UPI0005363A26|nr:DUF4129 domain-containing protein [Arthrobacter sp. PAMC 25486]AIY01305.1 hypothetical protein ART_1706 [Arthrobacter sp. PAMC 25486]